MSENIISVKDLCVRFDDHQALDHISVEIPQNSYVAIVGPNGAGKSTFFRILLGLLQPTKGTVRVFGKEPAKVPANWIGYVPQIKTMDRTFPALAIELVMTGLNQRWPWSKRKKEYHKALAALEQVGSVHLARRPIRRLSGGELQRVCLARSIVRNPKLVMLDEPATGIDAIGEEDLYRFLEAYLGKSDSTILMITHDWHAATHHADHVMLMDRRLISFAEPAEALKEDNLRQAFGHVGHKHPSLAGRSIHG